VVSLVLSFLMVGVIAAATSKWSAARVGPAMLILLAVVALLFIAGIVFVHWTGKRINPAGEGQWICTILYSVCVVITLLFIGFMTLIGFNR